MSYVPVNLVRIVIITKKASFIQIQHDFSWLYYDAVISGYKYKLCELFPEGVTFSNGKNKCKFSHEAVKNLSDH